MDILIVDDEAGIRSGLGKVLALHNYRVHEAESLAAARAVVSSTEIDVILLDLRLGKEDGFDFLKEVAGSELFVSVIVITGHGNIQSAVNCMNAGAVNYLTKPVDQNVLLSILEKERDRLELKKEHHGFRELAGDSVDVRLQLGRSPALRSIDAIIEKVKDSPASVLILGETGTGKEVVARQIHYRGSWAERPFVGVNCAALNEQLLDSELFGHERGAFTGAVQRKLGRFELAGRGTLFLDEVGDMSAAMQSKLLRVLEEGTFERVGGTKSIRARCRVIAATNRKLEDNVRAGIFREDLYYRLNMVSIELPPLRERKDDIGMLAEYFVEVANRIYGTRITGISDELMQRFTNYHWPGNIRELRNTIINAALLSDSTVLETAQLPDSHDREPCRPQLTGSLTDTVQQYAKEVERQLITDAIERHRHNITRAARELGVARKTLYEKMHEHGLE